MTDTRAADTQPRGSLRPNPYSTVTECLRIQSSARRQGLVARLFGTNPVLPDARTWYLAARGELQAAKALASLGADWTVLHTRELDAPDLLIGSAGIYTVATKNHSRQRVWVGDDQVLVNGHRTNHVRDARLGAQNLSRMLGLPVIPVLAIVDPGHFDIKQRPSGVDVISSTQLASYLARRPVSLEADAVSAVIESAEGLGPWSADIPDEALRHEARFARLVADVESAARRRAIWVAAGGLALVALVVATMLTV